MGSGIALTLPRLALIDANVFFAPRLCDLFMHLHIAGLIRIRWTAAINEEWTRNAALKSASDPAGIHRRLAGMVAAIEDWEVSGYEPYFGRALGVSPSDVHVAAAAIKLAKDECETTSLVTDNIRHFPVASFSGTDVIPITPSDFLRSLYREDAFAVLTVAEECRTKLKRSPPTQEQYVAILMKHRCLLAHDLATAWDVACPMRLPDGTLQYDDK